MNDYKDPEEFIGQTVHVNVTREDIDNGIKRHATCCPIALAVCRALEIPSEEMLVEVDGDVIFSGYDIETDVFNLSGDYSLARFIRKFDAEEFVPEIEFDLFIDEKFEDAESDE